MDLAKSRSVGSSQKVGSGSFKKLVVMGKYRMREGVRRMSRSDPRKASFGAMTTVSMICGHGAYFRSKMRPKAGEIIWCSRCADYKEVV